MNHFEYLKWNLLDDAAFEDGYMLWEAFAEAVAILEGYSARDQEELCERALRELYADGLIYFLRANGDVDAAASDPARRLAHDEVDEVLAHPAWREGSGAIEISHVSCGTTPKGQRLAEDPPPDIRRIWRPDEFGDAVGGRVGPRSTLRAAVSGVARRFVRRGS